MAISSSKSICRGKRDGHPKIQCCQSSRYLQFVTAGVFALAAGQALAIDPAVDFNRDIRPILSDKCYFCHGPDAHHREADLRFDTADGSADAIASGEFLRRVQSEDPDECMPPPQAKISLTPQEKDLLRRWVEAGAQYDQHWAFKLLPAAVEVPQVSDTSWPREPLDHFVLVALDAQGLRPAREADPLRWLRRVTTDLTGLPPTIDEVRAFQAAHEVRGEVAYAEVVDRLLDSPAYGEHMATAWLDSARYADSYGYQSDKLNDQWPYRDWVIRAFNDNLPYDQFITWQLAGDLLPHPTRDQRLATAFNRIHRLNNEGGAIFEEWRLENVADRVHTFGTAILGLTLECARCHDHKYDPISTRDYYSLSAFFNSIDENGLYDRTEKVPSPTMLLPTSQQEAALENAQRELAVAQAAYQQAVASATDRLPAWQSQHPDAALSTPDLLVALGFDEPFDGSPNGPYFPATDDRSPTNDLERVAVVDCAIPRLAGDTGPRRAAVMDGQRGLTVRGVEPFDRWTPFSVVVTFREPHREPLPSVIAHHTRGTDAGYNGWDLTIENGFVESRMYRVWPGNAIGVRTTEPIPADRWHQLAATYDGSSTAEGLKLYLNGLELPTTVLRDKLVKSSNVPVDHGGELVVGQRFRSRGFAGALIDDVRVFGRPLTWMELRHFATGSPLELEPAYFTSALDEPSRQALADLTAKRKEQVMAEDAVHEIPIMEEMDTPRPAHILARGQYDAPTSDETLVGRDTFERLPPAFPDDLPRDRLGLARWVTGPDHPLTGRVIVNRLWRNFFGAGLVRTPENFGLQGELPTHPELLDWLARDLIDHGWDIKRFCRNVALSATYRQDSAASAELIAADPENRLLARGPAYRLSAEQIRDAALTASGLLNRAAGGPPVSPYQAGGDLWRESNTMSPEYQQSVGKALYRRSLYSVWKRTAPLPNMMAFDATSREVCTVKRSRTNTPLQALVLLNDVQFVEAARTLATGVMTQSKDDATRISTAFLALTAREPDEEELATLRDLLKDERDYYRSNPADARKLIGLGESPAPAADPPEETAAMTVVCQAILNLDATIWSR
jgi:hypothetical protein